MTIELPTRNATDGGNGTDDTACTTSAILTGPRPPGGDETDASPYDLGDPDLSNFAAARRRGTSTATGLANTLRPADKPLLNDRDLPGPLSLNSLAGYGTLRRLDNVSGYRAAHADTLYGRSTILTGMVPRNATVCATTAAWLWLGGTFPGTVDVISRSHYRAAVHERSIRVFNRKSPPEHLIRVGDTRVTTPVRTVCDLALLPETQDGNESIGRMIAELMAEYQVTPADCLDILNLNPFWPRASTARAMFEGMNEP